jgi:hypothetical protein
MSGILHDGMRAFLQHGDNPLEVDKVLGVTILSLDDKDRT